VPAYSPERRTALVLSGTGVHGAYHAGVLRALQEAGVKIDLVAGHGIGAGAAMLAAVDGAARLWEPAGGPWSASAARRLYPWSPTLRAAGWVTLALAVALLVPVLVLGVGLIVYPLGFLLEMAATGIGAPLIAGYSGWVATAFTAAYLPTIVPRLAMALMLALVAALAAGAIGRHRRGGGRRARGRWWWLLVPPPIDAEPARRWFAAAVDSIVRRASPGDAARPRTLGRRYADLLDDNLGQPGFREVMLIATDLDARRDVVAALLREPYRRDFAAPRPGRERQSEIVDLSAAGKDHALDVLNGALTPPVGSEPALIRFAPDSFWRGETHRLADRSAALGRLLDEVAAAGASQAIVVSAVAPVYRPHYLSGARLDLRGRLGEPLAAAESTALRDALEMARLRFDSVYVICPAHNPIGAFDGTGAYDEASDRHQDVRELIDRAYEDAYRTFIEPVVGASGEHLAHGASTGYADERARVFDDDRAPR
jgi:hypothetical protein